MFEIFDWIMIILLFAAIVLYNIAAFGIAVWRLIHCRKIVICNNSGCFYHKECSKWRMTEEEHAEWLAQIRKLLEKM